MEPRFLLRHTPIRIRTSLHATVGRGRFSKRRSSRFSIHHPSAVCLVARRCSANRLAVRALIPQQRDRIRSVVLSITRAVALESKPRADAGTQTGRIWVAGLELAANYALRRRAPAADHFGARAHWPVRAVPA